VVPAVSAFIDRGALAVDLDGSSFAGSQFRGGARLPYLAAAFAGSEAGCPSGKPIVRNLSPIS